MEINVRDRKLVDPKKRAMRGRESKKEREKEKREI